MKELFASLMKDLREQKLVTEDKEKIMIDAFAKKFDETTAKIYENALMAAEKKLDEEHGQMFEKVIDKLDDQAASKMKEVMEALDMDHGTKATKLIEQALEKQDEVHGQMLEQIIEKQDAEATALLEQVIEKLDNDACEKMQLVKEAYETKYQSMIVEKLDKYFDAYLEETQPKDVILDAAKLERLEKAIKAIKEILMIDDEYVRDEVKPAIAEAKSMLEERDERINELMLQIAEVKCDEKRKGAKTYLESKISKASPKLRAFLEVTFKDCYDRSEIESKFDEAVTQFNAEESKVRETLTEAAKDQGVQPKTVITENLVQNNIPQTSDMDRYVSMIKKSINR